MSLALTAADLPDDIAQLKAMLLRERADYQKKLHSLLEEIRIEKQRLYGSSSEKSPDQTELFDEADVPAETAADGDESATTPIAAYSRRKNGTRKPLPDDLPRVRKVIELSEEERQCPCGCTLAEIGEDISEQLDIIPAQVQVIQTVRKKYACKGCEDTIKSAPRPNVLLPKAIASANTMAYVITTKYADGIPLYRQSRILERYHIELSRQTLCESVLKVAEAIKPLIDHLRQHLLSQPLLHMDETRVQVLKEPGKTAQSQSYMWVQKGGPPDQEVVLFNYDPSRSTHTANTLLQGYQGALMTDGYKPYRAVAQANGLTHLCCWAHARRKFMEAKKAQPKGKSGKADMAISFIAKLYAVEKHTKESDGATRHRTRQSKSVATLKSFHQWLIKTQQQVPPKTALGKAVNYTLEYWPELNRYTENGEWPIDNNTAENAIRPFVIGRKAWLFSNSQRGATGSANLYSMIETAKANGREPYHYLSWLFERLPDANPEELELLMPWNAPYG